MKRKYSQVKSNGVIEILDGNPDYTPTSRIIDVETEDEDTVTKRNENYSKREQIIKAIKHIESINPETWTLELLMDLVDKYKSMRIVQYVILESLSHKECTLGCSFDSIVDVMLNVRDCLEEGEFKISKKRKQLLVSDICKLIKKTAEKSMKRNNKRIYERILYILNENGYCGKEVCHLFTDHILDLTEPSNSASMKWVPKKSYLIGYDEYVKIHAALLSKTQGQQSHSISQMYDAIEFDKELIRINPYLGGNMDQFFLVSEKMRDWYDRHPFIIKYMEYPY
jgi:hypothetical protein